MQTESKRELDKEVLSSLTGSLNLRDREEPEGTFAEEQSSLLLNSSEEVIREEQHVTFPITVNVPKSFYIETQENAEYNFDEWEKLNIESPINIIDYMHFYAKPPYLIDKDSILGISPGSSNRSCPSLMYSEEYDNDKLNLEEYVELIKEKIYETRQIFNTELKSLRDEFSLRDISENEDEDEERKESIMITLEKLQRDIEKKLILLKKDIKESLRSERSLKTISLKPTTSHRFRDLVDTVVHGIKIEKELIKLHDESPKRWKITELMVLRQLGGNEGRYILLVLHQPTAFHYVLRVLPKVHYNTKEKVEKMMTEKHCYEISKRKHNLIQMYQAFETSYSFCFLLEYAIGSDLGFHLNKFGRLILYEAKTILMQIFKAIDFLHKKKIIHRNVQLSSILLFDECQVKLSDFGLCSLENLAKDVCGNDEYRAPEMDGVTEYSFEIDIWSFGVIAYKLLVSGNSENVDKSDILKESKENFVRLRTVDIEIQDLLKKILKINPKDRIGQNNLYHLLKQNIIFSDELI
ncbi:protein kinase C iota type-like isoform X2 [Centruroides sculpturatus]|uniref:protein kinase C iota type-like isoform X2 n=2 Tax=Centruroides sculpturatus TaxID=218467 RepID=UPI000C6E1BC9|nr:protein kinase C iota type-like isoform X2 [Centruroides sculpturatus]